MRTSTATVLSLLAALQTASAQSCGAPLSAYDQATRSGAVAVGKAGSADPATGALVLNVEEYYCGCGPSSLLLDGVLNAAGACSPVIPEDGQDVAAFVCDSTAQDPQANQVFVRNNNVNREGILVAPTVQDKADLVKVCGLPKTPAQCAEESATLDVGRCQECPDESSIVDQALRSGVVVKATVEESVTSNQFAYGMLAKVQVEKYYCGSCGPASMRIANFNFPESENQLCRWPVPPAGTQMLGFSCQNSGVPDVTELLPWKDFDGIAMDFTEADIAEIERVCGPGKTPEECASDEVVAVHECAAQAREFTYAPTTSPPDTPAGEEKSNGDNGSAGKLAVGANLGIAVVAGVAGVLLG